MRLVFLDIDGCLNGHEWNEAAKSNPICQRCVGPFNRLLRETEPKIVLSSAWRYMVLGGAMTLTGFEYMLRTHGIIGANIVGHTVADEVISDRTLQIQAFVDRTPELESWIVIDDMPLGFRDRQIRPHEKIGLTEADVDQAIQLLLSQEAENGL